MIIMLNAHFRQILFLFSADAVARDRVDRVLTKSRSTATASTASPPMTRSTATPTAVAVAVAVADFYYPTLCVAHHHERDEP